MTFYLAVLCEQRPIATGLLSYNGLEEAVRKGFYLYGSLDTAPCEFARLSSEVAISPADTPEDVARVLGDMSEVYIGGWGPSPLPGLDLDAALARYMEHLGFVVPGIRAGIWEYLTGPKGDAATPRLQRLDFPDIHTLTGAFAAAPCAPTRYNEVYIAPCV